TTEPAPIAADGGAIARQAESGWFAIADYRLWKRPARDRPIRFARASAPAPRMTRAGGDCRSGGIAPPTRGWRRTLDRCLSGRATSAPSALARRPVARRAARPV